VFSEIVGLLRPGDLLVANDSRVMAARLRGQRATGGAVELVCLELGELGPTHHRQDVGGLWPGRLPSSLILRASSSSALDARLS
jgi:hypothetical protein